ncbi:hypothetical protein MJG53_020480 [Ovis ammon polii x Ovis aries]|uniref:Spermatid-specific manchette-related protein 1 n=2 Tax=Ovis TaxID=9935 RepID=A0AAD4YCJ0_OVIAM|nr:hypothetical protein MG293_007761 [Ovis ammon polii]KAI4573965.1 hypothetical protein MJT46_019520 [Ovis ammon polii x Ovis aries]KAI4589456.1 hypothetical protein MJG53_020480 [Ovis ammon polii x Ovis aries]
MFLFSRKTKTPISTYSDSYRAPTSIKEVYKDPPLWAWEANKFVTRGLTQTAQRHVDPDALQKMLKCAVQDYSCKGSIPSHPYFPEKYWLCPEEGRALLLTHSREVVVNMLNSLSRNQPLPQITPRCGCVDPLPGRLPFQGYESACSGRHYCLRGMDYSVSGPPCTERRLRPLCTELPTVRFAGPRRRRAPPPNKWDTSHFKKTGGSQRNNYVVHPEFVSETYPDYHCW